MCGGWRDYVQCLTQRLGTPRSKIAQLPNIINKINLLAFMNMCLDVAKPLDRHKKGW